MTLKMRFLTFVCAKMATNRHQYLYCLKALGLEDIYCVYLMQSHLKVQHEEALETVYRLLAKPFHPNDQKQNAEVKMVSKTATFRSSR